jgi:type IV pilus assembly protein PilA
MILLVAWKVYCRSPMRRAPASSSRGFTLVELLVVIAMVGILAALAIVGFRKYINAAGIAEPKAMIQLIRQGEVQYKIDAAQYLGCAGCGPTGCAQGAGTLTTYYPMATPSSKKYTWQQPSTEYECWRRMNVTTDGTVRFGYSVVAGGPTDAVKQPVGFAALTPFQQPDDAWFVVQAAGNRDEDGQQALLCANSWSNEVYFENDTE